MPAWLTRRRTGWLSVWLARLSEFRERVQPCPFMFVCSASCSWLTPPPAPSRLAAVQRPSRPAQPPGYAHHGRGYPPCRGVLWS
ncbi:hypothetical protein BC831DRAFT_459807 [Entophlyctis helioformis]|nr:hypothetical protein BC831DRAFT_459807 [Entophlyctis helioformis]